MKTSSGGWMAVVAILAMGSGARGATVTGNATQLPDSFNVGGLSVTTAGPSGMYVRIGGFTPAVTTWRYDNPCQLAVTDTNYLPPADPTGTVSYTVSAPVTVGTLVARRSLNSNSQPSAFQAAVNGAGTVIQDFSTTGQYLMVATLPQAVLATQLVFRIEMVQITGSSPNGEVYGEGPRGWQTLADRLEPITVAQAGVTASHASTFPSGATASDLVRTNANGTYYNGGAYWPGQDPGVEITMDLGIVGENDEYPVAGVVLSNRADHRPNLDIYSGAPGNWSSTPICNVTVTDTSNDELVIVKFTEPVTTSHLKFVQAANTSFLLFNLVPLRISPEPPPKGTVILMR